MILAPYPPQARCGVNLEDYLVILTGEDNIRRLKEDRVRLERDKEELVVCRVQSQGVLCSYIEHLHSQPLRNICGIGSST